MSLIPSFLLPTLQLGATGKGIYDWDMKEPVPLTYISSIRAHIGQSFPQPKWPSKPYPEEHLKSYSLGFSPYYNSAPDMRDRYNFLGLRLPYFLQNVTNFFKYDFWDKDFPAPRGYITRQNAAFQYLNLLREYNTLYVDILEALNNNEAAADRIRDKIQTTKLYEDAGIDTKSTGALKEGVVSIESRRAMLAYLVLDIVRSVDENITPIAKVRALKILFNYGVEDIASAFSQNIKGFCVGDAQQEPVEDLIPRSFMLLHEEKGGTPHNDLFLKNARIVDIFGITNPQHARGWSKIHIGIDQGLSTMLQRYSKETVQVLLSILRCGQVDPETTEVAFHSLVNISKLDRLQKGPLFGFDASYQVSPNRPGLQSRIGATTGIGMGFGDDLDTLTKEELIARLRQQEEYLSNLEKKVAKSATVSSIDGGFNDHLGYCRILGVAPNAEDFDLVLAACYRAKALIHHPDKGGKKEDFQRLQDAFATLSNLQKRRTYFDSCRSRKGRSS